MNEINKTNDTNQMNMIVDFIYEILSKTDISPIMKTMNPYVSTIKKAYFLMMTILIINTIILIKIAIIYQSKEVI